MNTQLITAESMEELTKNIDEARTAYAKEQALGGGAQFVHADVAVQVKTWTGSDQPFMAIVSFTVQD